jgi:hypothetical protein
VDAKAPDAIPYEEALGIIILPKTIVGDLVWSPEPKGGATSECFVSDFALLDPNGATIPGLTVRLLYRRGSIKGECKSTFTIFKFVPPKTRAYQLEVASPQKQSHVEKGVPWKGPHKHIGDQAEQVLVVSYPCDDHERWFGYFLQDANINHEGKWQPPEEPDKQYKLGIDE